MPRAQTLPRSSLPPQVPRPLRYRLQFKDLRRVFWVPFPPVPLQIPRYSLKIPSLSHSLNLQTSACSRYLGLTARVFYSSPTHLPPSRPPSAPQPNQRPRCHLCRGAPIVTYCHPRHLQLPPRGTHGRAAPGAAGSGPQRHPPPRSCNTGDGPGGSPDPQLQGRGHPPPPSLAAPADTPQARPGQQPPRAVAPGDTGGAAGRHSLSGPGPRRLLGAAPAAHREARGSAGLPGSGRARPDSPAPSPWSRAAASSRGTGSGETAPPLPLTHFLGNACARPHAGTSVPTGPGWSRDKAAAPPARPGAPRPPQTPTGRVLP